MRSKQVWNNDTVRALLLYKFVLGILGVWPLDMKSSLATMQWCFFTTMELATFSSLTYEIYRHCRGYEDAMDAFLISVSSFLSLSKLLLHRIKWKHKYNLVTSMIEDWATVKDEDHRKTMTLFAERGTKVSLILILIVFSALISLVVVNMQVEVLIPWKFAKLINVTDRTLFLATYCIYDYSSLWIHYGVLLLQILQMIVSATSHCGSDGFFFGITMHLCGQFTILRTEFANLQVNQEEVFSRRRIGDLVRKHRRLTETAESMENFFSTMLLVQLMSSVLILCVEGFQVIRCLQINEKFVAAKHAFMVTGFLVQLFFYTFTGDLFERHTQQLAHSIYKSPWYHFSSQLTKDLQLVMLRGSVPHRITAGKFVSMNLMTFQTILKTTFSYISLLRVMLEV